MMKTAAIILLLGLSFCFSSTNGKSIQLQNEEPVFNDNDDGMEDGCSNKFNQGPCVFCSCVGGQPRCLTKLCAAPSCSDYVTPPGQCCPICPNGSDFLRDQ